MGTRNLTMVIKDGKPRVAQYGQWDGYPSGQGVTILTFLNHADLDHFKTQIDKCKLHKDYDKYTDEEQTFNNRDFAAEVLNMIHNSHEKKMHLFDSSKFAEDSLFCEWGYVIDLDKKTFEVYKGFNKTPLEPKDRFYSIQNKKEKVVAGQDEDDEIFYPIRLVKEYSLDALPSEKKFIQELEG